MSAIRLVAAGFMVLSLGLYCPDLFLLLTHHSPHHAGILALKAVPFVIGAVIYWKSEGLANWLTKDLD